MNFQEAFPFRLWLNLGRREDRRFTMEAMLEHAGVTAERFPAVDASRYIRGEDVRAGNADPRGHVRGYESAGRYALAVTQRLAIRAAKQRRAPSVLLLEDDAVFHPNFNNLIQTVDLPDDWGIFYLGCTHFETPQWAARRLVRVEYAVDTHAFAIRDRYYDQVMAFLDRHGKEELPVAKASDQFLALLHREIPTYSCYPNLAWQRVTDSDLLGASYSNYYGDGLQKNSGHSVERLLPELFSHPSCVNHYNYSELPRSEGGEMLDPKIALLFLTREDVHHPEIWSEFVNESPESVKIFSHQKAAKSVQSGFLAGTAIKDHYETQWGDISLVKASRSLLLSALDDPTLTHFILLSESCVPVRPLPEILRRLKLDPRPQFGFSDLSRASRRHASRAHGVPQVPEGCWHFQSQWWLLDRAAAIFAATEDFTDMFSEMTIPDEAYFATILSMQGYPLYGQVIKRDSTWAWWENDEGSPREWLVLTQERLRNILHSQALFARKFPKDSDIGKYGLHRTAGTAIRRT